jgi:hypothetical protein
VFDTLTQEEYVSRPAAVAAAGHWNAQA